MLVAALHWTGSHERWRVMARSLRLGRKKISHSGCFDKYLARLCSIGAELPQMRRRYTVFHSETRFGGGVPRTTPHLLVGILETGTGDLTPEGLPVGANAQGCSISLGPRFSKFV